MMIEKIEARLSKAQLVQFRELEAFDRALQDGGGYSVWDIEQHNLREFELLGEWFETLGIDDSRTWRISPYTGEIWYED